MPKDAGKLNLKQCAPPLRIQRVLAKRFKRSRSLHSVVRLSRDFLLSQKVLFGSDFFLAVYGGGKQHADEAREDDDHFFHRASMKSPDRRYFSHALVMRRNIEARIAWPAETVPCGQNSKTFLQSYLNEN